MWLTRLRSRDRQPEWMDAPDVDPQALRVSLDFIRRINRWLGYDRLMVEEVASQLVAMPSRGEDAAATPVRLLDVATGSADIPAALLRWADATKHRLAVVGIDLHADTLRIAADTETDPRLRLVRADATRLPLADAGVDYAISAMFLHHLSEADAITVLREMGRVARHGVIVSDLLRHRRAYFWISLFTLFSVPMVRHDARVSVAQAFTLQEVRELFVAAGMPGVQVRRRFGHRFVAVVKRA